MSVHFNIPARPMGPESSVYAGSSLNIRFDAVNGVKDASIGRFTLLSLTTLPSNSPSLEISRGAQQRDLIAFEFEADVLQRD